MGSLSVEGGGLHLFVGHGAAFRHAAYRLGVMSLEDVRRHSMYHAVPVVLEFRPDGTWRHAAGEWKVRKSADVPMD